MRTQIMIVVLLGAVLIGEPWCNGQENPLIPIIPESVVEASGASLETGNAEKGAEPLSQDNDIPMEVIESGNSDSSVPSATGEANATGPEETLDNTGLNADSDIHDEEGVEGLDSLSQEMPRQTSFGDWMSIKLAVSILFGLIVVIMMVLFGFIFCKSPSAGTRILVLESILACMLLLLISIGTYHLVSQIVQLNDSGRILDGLSRSGFNRSVLRAYELLSGELGRWFALFSVLGTFFGLVLPVGSYFLQVKTVARHENQVMTKIHDEVDAAKGEWGKLGEKLKETEQKLNIITTTTTESFQQMRRTLADKISHLWKQQALVAQLQILHYSNSIAMAWRAGNNDCVNARAFFYWSLIYNGCALYSEDEEFMGLVTRNLFQSFSLLFNDPIASAFWDGFAKEIKMITQKMATRFVVRKDVLTKEDYEQFADLLAGLGVQLSTDTRSDNPLFSKSQS